MKPVSADVKFRIHGAIHGYILGDMLTNHLTEKSSTFEYSHISAAMLSTAYSLTSMGSIDLSDVIEQLHNMYIGAFMVQNEELLNCGPSLVEAINHSLEGMPPDKTGVLETRDNEYFTLVLPAAITLLNKDTSDFIQGVQVVGSIINQTVETQICVILYALLLRNLILQEQHKVSEILRQYYQHNQKSIHLDNLDEVIGRKEGILWKSWDNYLSNKNDYEAAIRKCLKEEEPNLASALTGSFWGAANGVNDIPFRYVKELDLSLNSSAWSVINSLKGDNGN